MSGSGFDPIACARRFHRDEVRDEKTYAALARHVRDPALARRLAEMAQMEHGHAAFWAEVLAARGVSPPRVLPPWLRILLLTLIARIAGARAVMAALDLGEVGAARAYWRIWRQPAFSEGQRQRLGAIIVDELEHESWFLARGAGEATANVRDFVLGMNDGLVEILGAVAGFSAAYRGDLALVAVSGLVVGVAGALSMAIGAFVSVRSQREVDEAARLRVRILFEVDPARAEAEYRERLARAGVDVTLAGRVAEVLAADRQALSRLLSPPAADASPARAALVTGAAYALGVVFPVLPWVVADSPADALAGSVLLGGGALATTGGVVGLLSSLPPWRKVGELVSAGLGAAAVAFAIGHGLQAVFGIAL